MPFEPIRRLLPVAMQKAGISRQVTAARVAFEAEASLVRLWGEEKASRVKSVSFADGCLKCACLSGPAQQELLAWRTRWQNEINRALGEQAVKEIKALAST